MCLTAPPKPQKPNNFSFSRGLLNRIFGYGMVNLSSQLPISTDGFGHAQMGMSQNLGTLMNAQKKQMKPIPMPVQKTEFPTFICFCSTNSVSNSSKDI